MTFIDYWQCVTMCVANYFNFAVMNATALWRLRVQFKQTTNQMNDFVKVSTLNSFRLCEYWKQCKDELAFHRWKTRPNSILIPEFMSFILKKNYYAIAYLIWMLSAHSINPIRRYIFHRFEVKFSKIIERMNIQFAIWQKQLLNRMSLNHER